MRRHRSCSDGHIYTTHRLPAETDRWSEHMEIMRDMSVCVLYTNLVVSQRCTITLLWPTLMRLFTCDNPSDRIYHTLVYHIILCVKGIPHSLSPRLCIYNTTHSIFNMYPLDIIPFHVYKVYHTSYVVYIVHHTLNVLHVSFGYHTIYV